MKRAKLFMCICFLIYIIFLLYITLFGRLSERIDKISLSPFWSYSAMIQTANPNMCRQIFYNILAFIPLGILLPMLGRRFRRLKNILLCGFLLSALIESAQLLFHLGWCDIDDVINNTAGAVIGYGIWHILRIPGKRLIKKFLQEEKPSCVES